MPQAMENCRKFNPKMGCKKGGGFAPIPSGFPQDIWATKNNEIIYRFFRV